MTLCICQVNVRKIPHVCHACIKPIILLQMEEIIMTQKDICDIIIENTINDWKNSMNSKNQRGQWEIPEHSKSEINKAGKTMVSISSSSLRDINITLGEIEDATSIFNNWRAAHAYPLQVICNNLRLRNPNAIVVQRLKRSDSIIEKLKRNPDMNLYRMQDLGGCRVIVDTIDQVYEAVNKYKNSRIRHILKREYDYIRNPKNSGYRSYHMVYQFQSDKKETYNKNILIEIQFRTKLQHIWATAVEMMSIYTESNLKASQGNKNILRFFILVSSIFSIKENMPVCPNTSELADELIDEIIQLDKENNIIMKLKAINQAVQITGNSNFRLKSGYYLLLLNYDEPSLNIYGFKQSNFELAVQAYNEIERELTGRADTVLVSVKSFDILKTAYPNYFTDISEFLNMLKNIMLNYGHYNKKAKLFLESDYILKDRIPMG